MSFMAIEATNLPRGLEAIIPGFPTFILYDPRNATFSLIEMSGSSGGLEDTICAFYEEIHVHRGDELMERAYKNGNLPTTPADTLPAPPPPKSSSWLGKMFGSK
jgi:hypothetical protein